MKTMDKIDIAIREGHVVARRYKLGEYRVSIARINEGAWLDVAASNSAGTSLLLTDGTWVCAFEAGTICRYSPP
jgi:hypothetical protein